MSINLEKTKQAGLNLTEVVFIPHTEKEYKKLLKMLENLIDEVGENEDHPLASLMEIIGILIKQYDAENIPELDINPPLS